mgnify:CR=1 FL=1
MPDRDFQTVFIYLERQYFVAFMGRSLKGNKDLAEVLEHRSFKSGRKKQFLDGTEYFSGILYQIDSSIEEASISLGRSPMKTFFTVTARLMAPGVISGAILSWISTINELSSSIMLYSGRTGTISVAIYNEVARGGFGTAAALASILTLVTLLSLLLFQIISKGKVSIV